MFLVQLTYFHCHHFCSLWFLHSRFHVRDV